jgi:malate synthase
MMHNETAPYFYLPKLEHYLEALVEQFFEFARIFRVPNGTIKQLF